MDLWNFGILPQHYTMSQPRGCRLDTPKDGGSMDLWNVGILPQHYKSDNPEDLDLMYVAVITLFVFWTFIVSSSSFSFCLWFLWYFICLYGVWDRNLRGRTESEKTFRWCIPISSVKDWIGRRLLISRQIWCWWSWFCNQAWNHWTVCLYSSYYLL